MKETELQNLLHLFLTDSISDSDLILLQQELSELPDEELLAIWESLTDQTSTKIELISSREELFGRIWSDTRVQSSTNEANIVNPIFRTSKFYMILGAAAAILLLLFSGVFEDNYPSKNQLVKDVGTRNDKILPGGKHAKIILSDGTSLNLESLKVDSVVQLDGYSICKKADGSIVHLIDENFDHKKNIYNTIVTPKGGEFSLTLSDGSKIHLNADSKLEYPVEFVEHSRIVTLEGEAYFEIAKKIDSEKRRPFLVRTGGQTVEVLGTVFNINGYGRTIQTTLIEGSVKINYGHHGTRIIEPNQQSNYSIESGEINIHQVDPFYVVNWKNGMFAFEDATLNEVMDAIGRWYNVEIQFQENLQQINFSGTMSRAEDISKVLRTIELTGEVKFKRNGRRVLVMK